MSEFINERIIKKTRKPHRCCACESNIPSGSEALYWSGKDGDAFIGVHYHPDCRAAEVAYNKMADTAFDEWYSLNEIEPDDWRWLLEEHPAVADRMLINAERIAQHEDQQQRMAGYHLEEAKRREAGRLSHQSLKETHS